MKWLSKDGYKVLSKQPNVMNIIEVHEHDYVPPNTLPYRDVDRTKFTQETYTCECGAGYFERKLDV